MNVYFNRRKDPKRYEEMFLWSNLSELDAKYLQLIIITRTPVHTASYGSENLTHKSSYLWRTQTQGDRRDLYLGLLPSVVTGVMPPPGPHISPWTCQPSRISLLANPTAISLHTEPQRGCCWEMRGCFYTSKVPAQLSPGCKWKEWQDFYCWGKSKQNRQWVNPSESGCATSSLPQAPSCYSSQDKTSSFYEDRR